jgi:RimJ/RimL family protein N-acetyltransferase
MTSILIQALQEAHFHSFWQALDSVARERKWLIFLEAPSYESSCAFLSAMMGQQGVMRLAMDGNSVVGWCDIRRHDATIMAHCGTLGLGVIEGYRGRGLGKRLMQATLDAVLESDLGIERVELSVFSTNARAQALYQSVGFAEEGRKIDARRVDGVSSDLLLMVKWLPRRAV